jgi:predicted nucleic acid-binding protein
MHARRPANLPGADDLLTGDDDLLALRPEHAILTAREFYDQHLR